MIFNFNLHRTDEIHFAHFIRCLLNDITYLIHEGISKLIFSNLQTELESKLIAVNYNRSASDHFLSSCNHKAAIYISFATNLFSFLKKITSLVPDAFLSSKIMGRLVHMLEFNQVILAGESCQNLNFKEPNPHRFEPGQLLLLTADISQNLGTKKEFIHAIACYSHRYRCELIEKVCVILRSYCVEVSSDIDMFERFNNEVNLADSLNNERSSFALEHFPGGHLLFCANIR